MEIKTHHTIELPKLGITKYIPKQLSNCTAKEYNDVCNLLFRWQSGEINFEEMRVQAVFRFLNLKQGNRRINSIEVDAMLSNIYEISKLIDTFFTKTEEKNLEIILNLQQNQTPNIRPFIIKWFGPEQQFSNTFFGQYEDALHLYHLYFRNQDISILYKLMATYYLPKNAKYNKTKTDAKSQLIKKYVDFGKVYGFFLFFRSFVNYATSSKVLVEGNVIDMSILYQSTNDGYKSDIPGLGIKSIGFQLAESGVFGNLKELRQEPLWEIKLRLYDIRKRDMDQEAKQKAEEAKN